MIYWHSIIYILEYPPIDCCYCFVAVYLTLTDPLRIQPWCTRQEWTRQESEKRGPLKTSNISQTQCQQDGEKRSYSTDLGYPNVKATAIDEPVLQIRTDSMRSILKGRRKLSLPNDCISKKKLRAHPTL